MKKISILYESAEGHTLHVAERISNTLAGADCETTVCRSKHATAEMLTDVDGILLGGSIHMGRHHGKLLKFVEHNRESLNHTPTALFLVCLTAKDHSPEAQALVNGFFKDFETRTGFTPSHTVAVAGALKYTRYNFFKRSIMKSISEKEGGDIDTSKDYIYTDWDAVDAFATTFLQRLV
ncbi:MAG: protoporphyrinogen oxidase [Deltaproteobacteria bacterium]|nr:protoporphyrinogen oxidase [Deltaproteobacteria bacterium]MBN2672999.1 protoporphyrinogen oxidase [Deltaproteobacteria bacterium]